VVKNISSLRKGMLLLLVVGSFVCGLSSCTLETSDNGDFDGYWHLERVDTLETGGWCDYSQRRVFWGVQYKLLSCKDADVTIRGCYFRFDQTSDSIIVHTPYKNKWHETEGSDGGDIPILAVTYEIREYGINNLREPFYKEKLKGDKMILRSKMLRLYFVKF